MRVFLTYFKKNGKFYTVSEYDSQKPALHEIWSEIQKMMDQGKLPGLVEGHSEFLVLVHVPEHPHDHPVILGLS